MGTSPQGLIKLNKRRCQLDVVARLSEISSTGILSVAYSICPILNAVLALYLHVRIHSTFYASGHDRCPDSENKCCTWWPSKTSLKMG